MINDFEIIIIGAGPGGLFTAAQLTRGSKALILEKNSTSGIKLLMSGAGRCNITQSGNISEFFNRYGNSRRFIIPALKEFTNQNLLDYLNSRGLHTINKKGKIFPHTESSKDVLNLLLDECRSKGITINNNEYVISISSVDNGFDIKSNYNTYHCQKLVIATGGKSYPTTGSTGDGFDFAKSLGHTIEKPKPALTPVFIRDYKFAEISGFALKQRKITIFRDGKKVADNRGDIGFTHRGLSGPGILDLSRYIEANDTLRINLIDQNQDELRKAIIETAAQNGKQSIKNFLKSYDISENLIKLLLTQLNLDFSVQLAGLNKVKRNELLELFCEYPFDIQRIGNYNIAMVTKGGISLKEVSPKTMESKIIKNLYFVGEVLDIDGDTGGYNIQAAFSTAYLTAKSLLKK